jgi:hypothetical protein
LPAAISGILVALLNSYLSWIHPLLKQQDGRHVSGIPLIGNILVICSQVVGFGVLSTAVVSALALLLDTGGLPWFLLMTWKDDSLWDER